MNPGGQLKGQNALQALARLARPRPALEQCEFCSVPLGPVHRHLLEVAPRKVICACDPCALRFENVIGRWRLIPRDTRALSDFEISDAQWDALALPINLAFFYDCTTAGKVLAVYPGPGGCTESLLPLTSWEELLNQNPVLRSLRPDVEALLLNRLGQTRAYFLAPLDVCYELVGLLRLHWRGLSGGERVWTEVEQFFARLAAASVPVRQKKEAAAHA